MIGFPPFESASHSISPTISIPVNTTTTRKWPSPGKCNNPGCFWRTSGLVKAPSLVHVFRTKLHTRQVEVSADLPLAIWTLEKDSLQQGECTTVWLESRASKSIQTSTLRNRGIMGDFLGLEFILARGLFRSSAADGIYSGR